ncbi:MAG: hypothetical protein K0U03_01455 [Betaproteobacteria bacterium]|nr:hypothetical protein [Betaproteobacteria bacterium]
MLSEKLSMLNMRWKINVPTYEFDIFVKDKGHEFEVEVNGLTGEIIETEIELYDIGLE